MTGDEFTPRDYNESTDVERDDVTGEPITEGPDFPEITDATEDREKFEKLLAEAEERGGTPHGRVVKGKLS